VCGEEKMSIQYPHFSGNEPCRSTDPDAFFPTGHFAPRLVADLREICEFCPMKSPCAQWAIHHERFGFWGGLTPKERARFRARYGILFEPSFQITAA
jgi:hypothetical protein